MTSPSKFFSAALEAAEKLTQKSGTREQMRAMLEKYGAKPSELDYIGIPKFLADKPKVTRQELLDYIDANQVKPEEVLKRGQNQDSSEVISSLIEDPSSETNRGILERLSQRFQENTGTEITPDEIINSMMEDPSGWVDDISGVTVGDMTRHGQYLSQPASDKYTEHLVTLPAKEDLPPGWKIDPMRENGGYRLVDDQGQLRGSSLLRSSLYDSVPGGNPVGTYYGDHFEEPNILAHMRYDYDPDALRLEELQSDWLQEGRKRGFKPTEDEVAAMTDRMAELLKKQEELLGKGTSYRYQSLSDDELIQYANVKDELNRLEYQIKGKDKLPRAPLANVNDWTGMLVRRALLDAAEKDMKKLRLTSGEMQDSRYSPQPGRAEYYDKIIPNIINKYLKPFGSKLGPSADKATEYRFGSHREVNSPKYWEADIPDELKRRLLQKGKVPFFKHGGAVR